VIATVDKLSWFQHAPVVATPPKNLDAVIATSCKTVEGTMNIAARRHAWYIRGYETWNMPPAKMDKEFKRKGLINIVNSRGLQQKLRKDHGVDAHVVPHGLDLGNWQDWGLRGGKRMRIGCLYGKKPSKRWADFVELAGRLGTTHYEYIGIGSTRPADAPFLKEFYTNKDDRQLARVYSTCHVWFAPTQLEGLHNVPMEAALCGCVVVASNHPLNGMYYDYADEDTAMIYDYREGVRDAAKLIDEPDWSLIQPMRRRIVDRIGTREERMRDFAALLM
jgi:glycosyltransferase involved in cell wall biosynthesis